MRISVLGVEKEDDVTFSLSKSYILDSVGLFFSVFYGIFYWSDLMDGSDQEAWRTC